MRTLLLTALLALAATTAIESFWRARGHRPSIADDLDLWAQERARVYGPRKLVLIGGSRILLGYSFAESRRELPDWEPIQLAVGAALPGAALRDLGSDPEFRGLVIASVRAEAFERRTWSSQQDHVDHFHRAWSGSRKLGRWLRTGFESRLVFLRSSLRLDRIASELEENRALPLPHFIDVAPDRETRGLFGDDWRRPSPRRIRAHMERHFRISAASPPDSWLESALEVEGWIRRIHARGGRVALVRFPGSGEYRRTTARHYPRARYWDRLAVRTSATTVHFADVAGMASLTLPDHLHVDERDRDALTRALLTELSRQGFFDTASPDS